MTLPDERYRAVRETRRFLQNLVNSASTPGVPKIIRQQAHALLRHYPLDYDLDQLCRAAPEVLATRLEPLTAFVVSKDRANTSDNGVDKR
jgi:hypothetical protein